MDLKNENVRIFYLLNFGFINNFFGVSGFRLFITVIINKKLILRTSRNEKRSVYD